MPVSTPTPAAVTILHRGSDDTLEVFWVRRADELAFLGGFWAFPGGRKDERDRDLIATAARELREETGVMVPAEGASRFVPAGRTITPEWASVRFDATYYLVECPSHAEPVAAAGELVAGEWIQPAEALRRWERGERLTSPVVVRALRALAPGLAGAAERLRSEAEAEAAGGVASRLWDLAPGLAIIALRSPTLPPATHTNCFVVGGEEVIVIDPGSPYPDEQAALDEALAGRQVREIWVTHHHGDHVGGVEHLRARLGGRVPVAGHARTARLLAGRVTVDRVLADGEAAAVPAAAGLPERRLRAVFTPGHTPGHHAFLEETTGFVCAGDMVAGVGTVVVDPDEGDMTEYLASLGRLEALGARALLPAHGPVLASPAAKLAEYRRHRLWREQRVVDALAAARGPTTAGELVTGVYADVPAAVHGLAQRSLLAHLVKLVRDGRVAEDGGRFRLIARS
jgi:glyoxylase-like metal-dependent hydrolase (beta-lactamase superfamily II)/8-oxo-dGTP pyrophosphatase MutT (NUDIX family)